MGGDGRSWVEIRFLYLDIIQNQKNQRARDPCVLYEGKTMRVVTLSISSLTSRCSCQQFSGCGDIRVRKTLEAVMTNPKAVEMAEVGAEIARAWTCTTPAALRQSQQVDKGVLSDSIPCPSYTLISTTPSSPAHCTALRTLSISAFLSSVNRLMSRDHPRGGKGGGWESTSATCRGGLRA